MTENDGYYLVTQVRAAFGSIHLAYIGGAALAVFRGDFLYRCLNSPRRL